MKGYVFDIEYFINNSSGGTAKYLANNEYVLLFRTSGVFCEQTIPFSEENMVCTQTQYDNETLIIKDRVSYLKHGGILIGKREYYKEDGTLDHTEDMDKHFPVKWEQMEQILKDNDISLLTADSIFRYYDKEKDLATWSFIIKLPMEKGMLYVFDARTGEMLSKEIIDMRKEM